MKNFLKFLAIIFVLAIVFISGTVYFTEKNQKLEEEKEKKYTITLLDNDIATIKTNREPEKLIKDLNMFFLDIENKSNKNILVAINDFKVNDVPYNLSGYDIAYSIGQGKNIDNQFLDQSLAGVAYSDIVPFSTYKGGVTNNSSLFTIEAKIEDNQKIPFYDDFQFAKINYNLTLYTSENNNFSDFTSWSKVDQKAINLEPVKSE